MESLATGEYWNREIISTCFGRVAHCTRVDSIRRNIVQKEGPFPFPTSPSPKRALPPPAPTQTTTMSSSAREDVPEDTKVDELEEAAADAETCKSRRSLAFHLRSTASRSWKRAHIQHADFPRLFFSCSVLLFLLILQPRLLRTRQSARGVALLAAKTRRPSPHR